MSKKFSIVLVLCASTLCLSGCAWFHETGPCLGMGCPGNAPGHSAKAPSATAQHAKANNPNSPNTQTTAQIAPQ
jgi:hypothetical protein